MKNLTKKITIFNGCSKYTYLKVFKFRGAIETLNIAKKYKIKKAILKSKSPSCGKGKIYDGTFSDKLIDGNGITTALLIKNGIEVINSDEF